MTVRACYEAMEEDCAAALAVLESEVRVRRYLIRFMEDPTARMLFASLDGGRWADAFRAAHTLKGLCRGLGLTHLHASCSALTDALRDGGPLAEESLALQVKRDYDAVLQAASMLAGEA